MSTYWLEQLETDLSQGDICAEVPVAPTVFALTKLRKGTYRGVGEAYKPDPECPPDGNRRFQLLGRGPVTHVVVLSHSCELDKNESKGVVTIAQVLSTGHLGDSQRDSIFRRERLAFMPLPDIPGLGDCYADLRTTTGVLRSHLATRIASMAPDGRSILRQSFLGFFLRDELTQLDGLP